MRKTLLYTYHIAIILLAVASVAMAVADLTDAPVTAWPFFEAVDTGIWLVFVVDYAVRFALAKEKRAFFKSNAFDLIAIIPFNSLFAFFRTLRILRIARVAKLAKLGKLARLAGVGGRLKARMSRFLHMNGLIYVIYLNLASIALGAAAIYVLERGVTVHTFEDAVWWAFVTTTTVGYGDISPSPGRGRIVAAILMVFGIGLVSMLTGTLATYFTEKANQDRKKDKLNELTQIASRLNEEQLTDLIDQAKRADRTLLQNADDPVRQE